MKKKSHKNMYRLLRDLGNVKGIAQMTLTSMNAFIESIKQLKCSKDEVLPLYLELADAIGKSEPKIIPLIHLLDRFEMEMQDSLAETLTTEDIRERAITSLKRQIELLKTNMAKVTEHGVKYVNNEDVIIVHSASSVVTNILVTARKKSGKEFSVIILEHNPDRTRQTVQALRDAGIDYIVAPAHNLSHHIERATKMFVGAMTVTTDLKMVAPAGTAGTVSLCYNNEIPVSLFANSLHYSHKDSAHQLIYQEEQETRSANVDFSITTHSHDLVSLDLIDHIITEKGESVKES